MSKEIFKKIVANDPKALAEIKLAVLNGLDIKYEIDEAERKTEMVSKDDINPGDVIVFDGKDKTVSKKDIGKDNLLGKTIFGDSFKSGKTKVERVLYKKYKDGKLIGWVAQP